jgi:hypothetical protein
MSCRQSQLKIILASVLKVKMTTQAQAPQNVKIIGFVKSVNPWRRGEPTQFVIATMNSGDFTCAAPTTMFCNVQPGDTIEAFVQIVGDRRLSLTKQPFVMMPVDENNVKGCFIKALTGSGFGAASATDLYKALQAIAKRLGFNKPKPLAAVPPTILPNGMIMTVVNPRPKREDRLPLVPGLPPLPVTTPTVVTDPIGTQLIIEDEPIPDIPPLILTPVDQPTVIPPVVEKTLDVPTQILTPGGFMIPIPGAAIVDVTPTPPKGVPIGLHIKGIPKKTIAQEAGVLDDPEYKPTELSTGEDGVIAVLSELAGAYATTGSTIPVTTIMSATKLREQQVKDLLRWWHNQRSLRRLYLLGLTKKEIRGARMNLDYLYEQCMTNPYKVCAIPIDKCNSLMIAMGVIPKTDDVRAGEIIRKVHMNQEGCGHTCTPYHLLRKHFMDLPDYKLYLEKNFDVKYEFDAVYTRYAHKVETSMAAYFNALITKTAEKLKAMPTIDTPDMETALFECKTLNEEQKLAIQGALSHHISIIRGGAGVGKCESFLSQILMYNGDVKLAMHVKEGDLLMGPDSKPRIVLSTCVGKGQMYDIIPNKGESFRCNEPHVLTLKGFEHYIGIDNNKASPFIVRYSERSHRKSKAFKTHEEAETFRRELPEDIYDIPLNEYMKLPDGVKRYSYLFHVGVDFPAIDVPIDPYMIGYWLGDGSKDGPVITTADPEIVKYFNDNLPQYGLQMAQMKSEKMMAYHISSAGENHGKQGKNHLNNTLKNLNLYYNKHIPKIYKCNSRQVRLQLLAGLIDSDGHVIHNCIEISQKLYNLAEDIMYLAFSLGFMCTYEISPKSCMSTTGEMVSNLYTRVFISGEGLEEIPTILERKKLYTRQNKVRITCQRFEVKSVGEDNYCGWTLNGDGRYLHGDFLVTHNTMCIREIVRNLELRDLSYAACSFTGKAVSRIADVLKKRCAMTMDRMIAQANGKEPFLVCIVDEFSMVTLELMYRFVRAHPWDIRFIFVGDPGQLQPIGWGAVMLALIDSQRVPVYTLTTNHRIIKHELEGDAPQIGVEKAPGDIEFDRVILENANDLIDPDRKLSDPIEFREGLGFYIYFGAMAYVTTIAKSLFDSGIDHSRVKILCPYTEPLKQLNSIAQQIFLSEAKKVMDNKQRLWCVGDLVMMTHNNYTINVMNGEEGRVVDVDTSGVKVIFADGAEHKFNYKSNDPFQDKFTGDGEANTDGMTDYDGDELLTKHLVHSFAISVHKSQGSEYEFVIFFLPPHPSGKFTSFINRNLVYTAWTRTKRSVWTVTEKAVLDHAAATDPSHRYEYLCRRLYQSRNEDLEKEMEAITKPKVVVKEAATAGGGTDDGFFDHEDESMYEQHYQD